LSLKLSYEENENNVYKLLLTYFQAFGCVEAASDRICVQSQGKVNAHLSAEDLTSCCHTCGNG